MHKPLAMVFGLINVVQAQSLARDALKYLGALFMAKGIGDATLWEAATGLGVAIVGSIWSQYAAKQSNIVATAATIVPIDTASQRAAGVATPVQPNVRG